jgi:propanediol dehydratase large subunit
MARRHKRFEVLEQRPVNQDGFVTEWVEAGMMAMGSPNDPQAQHQSSGWPDC